ncbi:type II secretion system minor pseudopilin GspI [Marinobacter sp. 1Y8]
MSRIYSRDAGFTLLEVLVAVLIFGLIATAATQVASNYIGSFDRIRDKTLASWIAENKIAEMQLAENSPGISENTDELEYADRKWQIETVVSATEEPRIRRVDVDVSLIISDEPRHQFRLSGFMGDY